MRTVVIVTALSHKVLIVLPHPRQIHSTQTLAFETPSDLPRLLLITKISQVNPTSEEHRFHSLRVLYNPRAPKVQCCRVSPTPLSNHINDRKCRCLRRRGHPNIDIRGAGVSACARSLVSTLLAGVGLVFTCDISAINRTTKGIL